MINNSQYFVEEFIKNFLPNTKNIFFQKYFKKISVYLTLLLLALIIPSMIIFMILFAYNDNITVMKSTKKFLIERAYKKNNTFEQIQDLEDVLGKYFDDWKNKIFFLSFIDDDLSAELKKAEYINLESKVVPMLVIFIEESLNNDRHGVDIETLMEEFNNYLMIIGKEPFNKQQVISWYMTRLSNLSSFSGVKADLIKKVLNNLDKESFKNIEFDNDLYIKILNQFNRVNLPSLIFESIVTKFKGNPAFKIDDYISPEFMKIYSGEFQKSSVPFMYTKEGYDKYIKFQEKIFNKILLITHFNENLDIDDFKEIIKETNEIYLNNYVLYWSNYLSKVNFKRINHIKSVLPILKNISLDIFPLFKFSQIINKKFFIIDHKSLDKMQKSYSVQISKEEYEMIPYRIKNSLNYKLLDTKSISSLQEKFFVQVRSLIEYISPVVNNEDAQAIAFNMIKEFENTKESELKKALEITYTLPEPIAHLYQDLITNLVSLLYKEAAGFINKNCDKYKLHRNHFKFKINQINELDGYLIILKNISFDHDISELFKIFRLNSSINTVNISQNNLPKIANRELYFAALKRLEGLIGSQSIESSSISNIQNQFLESAVSLVKNLLLVTDSISQESAAFNTIKEFESVKKSELKNALGIADILPEDLSRLYQNLLNNIITLLYNKAESYVNEKWQEEAYKFCYDNLYAKYPLSKGNYNQQIKLGDFKELFSKNGILENFSKKYLILQNIEITDEGTNFFKFAKLIQQNWFNQNGEIEIKFNLLPIQMDNKLSSIDMNLLGKNIQFTQRKMEPYLLLWPNVDVKYAKSVVTDSKNYTATQYYEGEWAWYKILGLDNVEQMNQIKTLQKNVLNSPLGKFEFSLNFNKEILLLNENVPILPLRILKIVDNKDFYANK